MKYRLAMFDFDGTLVDSAEWFLGAINEMADEFGFDHFDPVKHAHLRNLEALEVMRRLRTPLWKLPAIMRRSRELAARDAHKIRPFAGVHEMLGRLDAGGVQIAVVTSNGEQNVRKILGAAPVQQFHCGAGLMGKAPKIRAALKAAGVQAKEAIYVGDEIRDIHASRKAGVPFGAVTWGYTTIQALQPFSPDEIFDGVAEIADKILAPSGQASLR